MTTDSADIDHNRIIVKIAHESLGRHGFSRRLKSRIWWVDHGWWLGMVEFQPGRGRGTYLNVGVTWLWEAKGHLSYDEGGRVSPFVKADDEQSFSRELTKLTELAATKISSFERQFHSLQAVADYFATHEKRGVWGHFHAGICAGLVGDASTSKAEFEEVISSEHEVAWVQTLQKKAVLLSEALLLGSFRSLIGTEVIAARRLLALPDIRLGEEFGSNLLQNS